MRSLSRVVPLLLGLSLAACSGMEVNTNYDPQAVQQLDAFRSYAWLPQPQGKDPRVYNDIMDAQVKETVDRDLGARGYKRVEPGDNPDFLIGWQGAIDSKLSAHTVNSYYGYAWDPFWDPFYGPAGVGVPQTYVHEYEEGTLILDVVDAKANKLVWRGTAQAELRENPSQSSKQKRVDEAVGEMLSRFPPKAKE